MPFAKSRIEIRSVLSGRKARLSQLKHGQNDGRDTSGNSTSDNSGNDVGCDSCDSALETGLFGLCAQLAQIVRATDYIFDELISECKQLKCRTDRLMERTHRLVNQVEKLNAKSATVPEGNLTSLDLEISFCSKYVAEQELFTLCSRSLAICQLYSSSDETPTEIISKTDIYRDDILRGSLIFSRPFVVLNDYRNSSIEKTTATNSDVEKPGFQKCVLIAPLPHKKIRPKSLPEEFPDDTENRDETATMFASVDEMNKINRSQFTLVPIDISGSKISQLSNSRSPTKFKSELFFDVEKPQALLRPISGTNLAFKEINCQKHLQPSIISSKSLLKSHSEKSVCQTLEIYAPPKRGKYSEFQKIFKGDAGEPQSCSWRQSLKSLFQRSKSQSSNLWLEDSGEQKPNDVIKPIRRVASLPRSVTASSSEARLAKISSRSFRHVRSASDDSRLNVQPIKKTPIPTSDTLLLAGSRLGKSLTILSSRRHSRPLSVEISMPSIDAIPPSIESNYLFPFTTTEECSDQQFTSCPLISDVQQRDQISSIQKGQLNGKTGTSVRSAAEMSANSKFYGDFEKRNLKQVNRLSHVATFSSFNKKNSQVPNFVCKETKGDKTTRPVNGQSVSSLPTSSDLNRVDSGSSTVTRMHLLHDKTEKSDECDSLQRNCKQVFSNVLQYSTAQKLGTTQQATTQQTSTTYLPGEKIIFGNSDDKAKNGGVHNYDVSSLNARDMSNRLTEGAYRISAIEESRVDKTVLQNRPMNGDTRASFSGASATKTNITFPRTVEKGGTENMPNISARLSTKSSDSYKMYTDNILLSAVSAQLIISSPLAVQARFVQNPHKRSMCQAIATGNLSEFLETNDDTSMFLNSFLSNGYVQRFPENNLLNFPNDFAIPAAGTADSDSCSSSARNLNREFSDNRLGSNEVLVANSTSNSSMPSKLTIVSTSGENIGKPANKILVNNSDTGTAKKKGHARVTYPIFE